MRSVLPRSQRCADMADQGEAADVLAREDDSIWDANGHEQKSAKRDLRMAVVMRECAARSITYISET